jgi:hypothetical protein
VNGCHSIVSFNETKQSKMKKTSIVIFVLSFLLCCVMFYCIVLHKHIYLHRKLIDCELVLSELPIKGHFHGISLREAPDLEKLITTLGLRPHPQLENLDPKTG